MSGNNSYETQLDQGLTMPESQAVNQELPTIEQVEAQAKVLEQESRKLIALAVQCATIDPYAIQELNASLISSTNLLRYISDIKSDKARDRRLLGNGCAAENRYC